MEIQQYPRTYAKGSTSRESILNNALPILNALGDRATLDVLVHEMGMSRGRITHHFPTKDKLVKALHERFERSMDEAGQLPSGELRLKDLADAFRRSLIVQEKYAYVAVVQSTANCMGLEMHDQTRTGFQRRLGELRNLAERMVEQGLLAPRIMDQRDFDTWTSGLVMCFMAWPIHHRNVQALMACSLSRSIALRAFMNTFVPYLTKRGQKEFQLLFPLL